MNEKSSGQVTIAPGVLVTIVQLTTRDVPGVHAMTANWSRDVSRFFGGVNVGDGVQIRVHEDGVTIDVYVIVEQNASMLQLARRIQKEVARAVQEMTGMRIQEVNVHISDVCYTPAEP
ncbi:MAG: Asp23/Gls24 family envelope stress response protein [Anaerolineae bacterium]|nr:Asp23/Gls24 family envelope stress response protein [Anaerolineae bacterium]